MKVQGNIRNIETPQSGKKIQTYSDVKTDTWLILATLLRTQCDWKKGRSDAGTDH